MKILRKPGFAAFLILQCTEKSYFLFQVFLDSQVFLEKGYIFLVNARSEFCLRRNKKNKTFQAIMHPIETCLEKTTIKLKDLYNWSL